MTKNIINPYIIKIKRIILMNYHCRHRSIFWIF